MLASPPLLWVFVCKDTDLFSIHQIFNIMSNLNEQTAKSWGGARNGAGRKRKYVRNVFFSATQKVADILDQLEEDRSDFINRCIMRASGKDE